MSFRVKKLTKKRPPIALSASKQKEIQEKMEEAENTHTSRKMLSLLEAAAAEKSREQTRNAFALRKASVKPQLQKFHTPQSDLHDEQSAENSPLNIFLDDLQRAMEALRKECRKDREFLSIDSLDPFAESLPLESAKTPLIASASPKPRVIQSTPSIHSIINQWKSTQKPLCALSVSDASHDAPNPRWVDSCASDTSKPPFEPIQPEEFTDLLDPVGFGETNYQPPAFRAIPRKNAKLLPLHRMSASKRQSLRPEE